MKQFHTLDELRQEMDKMTVPTLRAFARSNFGVVPGAKKRAELIDAVIDSFLGHEPTARIKSGRPPLSSLHSSTVFDEKDEPQPKVENETYEGILFVMPDGFGFLRTSNYTSTPNKDVYVPPAQIKRFGLRSGDKVKCDARFFPERTAPSLVYIHEINDMPCADALAKRVSFENLVACHPNQRMLLENGKNEFALRVIDLIAPIGKGQRGLIVAPPKAGKTVLLQKIAKAIRKNHPEVYLTVLLIDERPEEVTDFRLNVDCDVVASTFDQTPSHHVQMAELVVANAKRRVECGQDVMILMDSITRLARAYNQVADGTGRTLTGGLDISALQEPKKIFGASRNVMDGGSLTIIATALVDTGSKMDDIIYEEFKGTGNMEIHLDRSLSEKRIFPAIDLNKSSTRREDLLMTTEQLEGSYLIRKSLSRVDSASAIEELLDLLMCTPDNGKFIETLKLVNKKKIR